jgi:uncharacterized protein (UPF0212 family)
MTQLMIKCKNCGFEFPAATQMNEEALMAINIENNNESCPKCKRSLDCGFGQAVYHLQK